MSASGLQGSVKIGKKSIHVCAAPKGDVNNIRKQHNPKCAASEQEGRDNSRNKNYSHEHSGLTVEKLENDSFIISAYNHRLLD